ncbi:hypothetical protein BH23THE1_BH23THE1_28250 [soil metagenome]
MDQLIKMNYDPGSYNYVLSSCYPTPLYSENHGCSSFTGLSVKQFDDIFKEIESRYDKYEIKRLSSRKERRRERAVGDGRRFKIVVKNRIIMVLVYYRLYITYTLMEFLFGLDQSNVCRHPKD